MNTMVSVERQFEIIRFYNTEAYLLDHRKFEEWLDLLADNIVYRMPLRVTREEKDGPNIRDDMTLFEESKLSLTTRVKRLRTSSAWAENHVPRTRHLITNILVEKESGPDEMLVRTSFLFLRSRGSDIETEHLFGERLDVLKKIGGDWKVASRTIYPDQAVITTKNLSMFL